MALLMAIVAITNVARNKIRTNSFPGFSVPLLSLKITGLHPNSTQSPIVTISIPSLQNVAIVLSHRLKVLDGPLPPEQENSKVQYPPPQ